MEAFKNLLELATARPWLRFGYLGEHDEGGIIITSGPGLDNPIATTAQAQGRSAKAREAYEANARLLTIGANHVAELVDAVLHLSWCRTCAEDGLHNCQGGREIKVLLDTIEEEASRD